MTCYYIIVLLLTVSYVLLFIVYLSGWILTPEFKFSAVKLSTKVSIIVAARNEAKNIGRLLDDLAAQNYPSELFEIIVSDDWSDDDTALIITSYRRKPVLLIRMEAVASAAYGTGSKKNALQKGIEAAFGELIITTDADCTMDTNWLQSIVAFYEHSNKHMIVAPVLFSHSTGFFERWQALDLLGMIGITGATLNFRLPALCNGANLAFRKTSFEAVNGYDGISRTSSGDDVLLMQKMTLRWKGGVHFLKSNEAVVRTAAQRSLSAFISQRIRWTSKSNAYLDRRVVVNLVIVYLFNLSLIITTFLSFWNVDYLWLLAVQIMLKIIPEFAFLSDVTAFFRQRQLLWLFLPAQLLHIIYIAVIGTLGNFIKVKWKGRRIH